MSIQHWTASKNQPIGQGHPMQVNQSVPLWVGQHTSHQYLVSNQGMQQCVLPLINQSVTYQQQAPMFSHYISSNNPLPPSLLANQPIVTSTPGPILTSDQMPQAADRQIDEVRRSCETSFNQQPHGRQYIQRQETRYFTPKKI